MDQEKFIPQSRARRLGICRFCVMSRDRDTRCIALPVFKGLSEGMCVVDRGLREEIIGRIKRGES